MTAAFETTEDCFFTQHYKGDCFIHSKQVRQVVGGRTIDRSVVTWTDDKHKGHPASSWRGAQLAISRYLKGKA